MDKQVKMNKGAAIQDSFFITQLVLYIEDLLVVHLWGWQCLLQFSALRGVLGSWRIDFPEGFCLYVHVRFD